MKRVIFSMWFTLIFVFAMVFSSFAEEAKPVGLNADEIKKALGLSINLQGGYTYNFRNPDSGENRLRVFDHEANSFNLDLAQIVFAKDAPMNGVGFKLKLSAGETAKWIHSRGLGINDGDDPSKSDAFDLTEAYIDYLAPVGKGLKLRFGKYATYFGAEVIEAKDNPNYSRSLLFNYAIPFTHTGLMVGYSFTDALSANLHVVNGWDNTSDNNKGKTVGLSVGYAPMEQLSMYFNTCYGPEQLDNSSNNRFLFDWVATIKPVKNLSLILNADYATEDMGPLADDVKWHGFAAIAKYDFTGRYSLAVRGEYFKDSDGARTGIKQSVKEITITPEIRLANGIIIRPEYRHDWSDKQTFDSRHDLTNKKSQDTIALAVMYSW
ncbi:MAG: porin [Nitrospirae bacterium]|nr:porin [Nitrospirota bacterium]